jgi:hypothetical protein
VWGVDLCPARRKVDQGASLIWAADLHIVTRRPCGSLCWGRIR